MMMPSCRVLYVFLLSAFGILSLGSSFIPNHQNGRAVLINHGNNNNNLKNKKNEQVQSVLHSSSKESNQDDLTTSLTKMTTTTAEEEEEYFLGQSTKGGYTVKQRLREEVESPFRKVRLAFFSASFASAMIALYFSALSTAKSLAGGFADAQPLDEVLTSDAINIGAAIVCGYLAYRDYRIGEANLERIARGGKLASLVIEPARKDGINGSGGGRKQLASYRRFYRVLIAAGGEDYISRLGRSLAADQLKDANILPEKLQETDIIVVPVLLKKTSSGSVSVGDVSDYWSTIEGVDGEDRNFDIARADPVVAYPKGTRQWADYLQSEIDTAAGQGFDVLEKGITLIVKKNGRILRRVTGLPPWGDLINTMEVIDGSRFGMPGDSEKYGGP